MIGTVIDVDGKIVDDLNSVEKRLIDIHANIPIDDISTSEFMHNLISELQEVRWRIMIHDGINDVETNPKQFDSAEDFMKDLGV